jgi:hypothetical protein
MRCWSQVRRQGGIRPVPAGFRAPPPRWTGTLAGSPRSARPGREAGPGLAGLSRWQLQCSYGPVIAKTTDQAHLPRCRDGDAPEPGGNFRVRAMKSERAPRDWHRPGLAVRSVRQNSWRLKEKQFVKPIGAKLSPCSVKFGVIVESKQPKSDRVASTIACNVSAVCGTAFSSAIWQPRLGIGEEALISASHSVKCGRLNRRRPQSVRRYCCALVTQAFTAESYNAVF